MLIRLEVWKSTSLQVVCEDDKFGSLEAWKVTHCVR